MPENPTDSTPTTPDQYSPPRNRLPPHWKGDKKGKIDAGLQNTPQKEPVTQ